jgi:ABC-2 type transport system ATP-binding protein
MAKALEIKAVSKEYYTRKNVVKAVGNLSFILSEGSVMGFLGPNGAGKTTTMKMILGLDSPTKGTIKIFNQPVGSTSAARYIGYLPENPLFYRYLSGLEMVIMHGQLMGLNYREAKKEAVILLKSVGLESAMNQSIREYSKGMVQRAGLAQALIGNPAILLLDEPFSGLDVLGRYEMKKVLLDLKKQGKTILFNSHILSEVEEICDEVGIIDQGKLLIKDNITKLLKPKQSLENYFVSAIEAERSKHVK